MQIYQEFGQDGKRMPFSNHALIALTSASDPQAAVEEAAARQDAIDAHLATWVQDC